MEVREELKEIIERARAAAEAAGELPRGEYAPVQRLEIPKAKEFGDYSTNAAMQWARTAHKAPRAIAESIVKYIDAPLVSKMEIAGAGIYQFLSGSRHSVCRVKKYPFRRRFLRRSSER